jgi:hypothetical protein
VIGESMEGMGVDFPIISSKSTHGPFCIGGVEGGDSDVSGPGVVPEMGDDEGGEVSLIVDKVNGACEVAVGDRGGGGLGLELDILVLRDGKVWFGLVQQHFFLNLELNHRSGSGSQGIQT